MEDLKQKLRTWRKKLHAAQINSNEFRVCLAECQKYEAMIIENLRHNTIITQYHKSNIGNYEGAIKALNELPQKSYMFGGLVGDKPSLLHRFVILMRDIWNGT